ncbi:unnamed protein product [Pseudo-nitzschia multistriata]|uniref:Ion transport domain-containing protein n=1 Tax=Pseudo-nitzschia multistriata TaxID=183589 RepID=A0A448ZBR6_9STRA|nr:unnamed protein product [Pseudo-nitzschia multistriata]
MCNSQQPKSTDITQNKFDADDSLCDSKMKCLIKEIKPEGDKEIESSNTNNFVQPEPQILPEESPSRRKSHGGSVPHIPFLKTFGRSETFLRKQGENTRLSLDSQHGLRRRISERPQPLRRRARSSEGFILKNNMVDYFGEDEILESRNSQERQELSIAHLEPRFMKNEMKRRTIRKSSPRNTQHISKSLCEKTNKVRSSSVIPIEHPFKIIWDVLTVILSVVHSYFTHMAIRDRRFEPSPFISFCQAWFLLDILLNFFTERKTNTGKIISDPRKIVARYLTSWFAIDILSLLPWEVLYVKPLIETQNRRGFFKKSFFRSKAVVRVTTHLRGKHFRWFGSVAKHTKHHGVGAQRLLRLIIKYVPKYLMFLRNMKGVIACRILRFVHWSRRSMKNIESKPSDASTGSMSTARGDDDKSYMEDDENSYARQKKPFEVVYDWENIDDGVPL